MSDFESGAFNRALPTLLPDKFTRKNQIGKGRAGKMLYAFSMGQKNAGLSAASSQKREDSGRDDRAEVARKQVSCIYIEAALGCD